MLQQQKDLPRKFRVPYINGRYIVPMLYVFVMCWLGFNEQEWVAAHVNPLVNAESAPNFIFFIVFAVLALFSFLRNLSLIPVLGILSCLYLMAQIHVQQWVGFAIWLLIGLAIYFTYGYRNSRLAKGLA